MNRTLILVLSMTLLFALTASASPMDGLSEYKDFKAKRVSSYDPSGGNADGRQDKPIQPGETRELAAIDGSGMVTHIWVTIASGDPHHLKNLVLRMYWDGEQFPSVECPIGDFFGLAYGRYYQYDSLPIQIGTNNGLNCYWHMPFKKGARITVTNDGPVACGAFYYYIDYREGRISGKKARFHAQYRQDYPCKPGENYLILDARGKGQYVGCNLSIHNRQDGWWGEGDDMIYVDGEDFPSLHGTGSEDYFCGAWCYGEPFSNMYFGCPLRGAHATNAYWNVYRYHIEDPVPFKKSIRVTIEHGHANDRFDDFTSVAYWYQNEPHMPFPQLPAAADRLPEEVVIFTEESATENEAEADQYSEENRPAVQDMGVFHVQRGEGPWSAGQQLFLRQDGPGKFTRWFVVDKKNAGNLHVEQWYTCGPDYGLVEVYLNGKKVAEWDGYAPSVVRRKTDFDATFTKGKNALTFAIERKNEASTGFLGGLDCYRLTPKQ